MLGQGKLARTGKSDSENFWPRQSLENILILLNGKRYACTSGEGYSCTEVFISLLGLLQRICSQGEQILKALS